MNLEDNFILKTDSYKVSHVRQLPVGTNKIYSYLESRGGRFSSTLFFGLQYILKRHFAGILITKEAIDQAEAFWKEHFFGADLFNREGWEYIVKEHGGRLPLKIMAVKEGSVVGAHNVLMTIENTDPKAYGVMAWLTNYSETLLSNLWYSITVSTNSFECKKIIKRYLEETHGDITSLPFKLHDFGMRGISCYEQGAIGGASHLVNFMGTDTTSGIICAMNNYKSKMCGFSIPASEHSTITSWGKEHEVDAYRNMLKQYPTGFVACVSDSYDIYNACDKLWGDVLRDEVLARSGTLVIRPDSGDPVEVNSRIIDILWNKFGGDYNSKHCRVLNSHVRVIQGDGIDLDMIEKILQMYKTKGFSAENIAFGSGGGLLQKFDRDTNKFAIKCSYAEINGVGVNVYKDPITSGGKTSKKGKLKLHSHPNRKTFSTISSADDTPQAFNSYINELEVVFENGELKREQSFDDIRKISEEYL